VVAFTNQRALFVASAGSDVVAVDYGDIEIRRRPTGLGIDALIEGSRLVLDVAKGTFVRLAVVGAGAPPGRATWLPVRTPPPAPAPPPMPDPEPSTLVTGPAPVDLTAPPRPPVSSIPPVSTFPPVPPVAREPEAPRPAPAASPPAAPGLASAPPPSPTAVPSMPPPGLPPAGWNPDPSGRHWWRWWDGMAWTDHVADGGASFIDPLPPR
jgi:hypothetical protein